MAYELHIERKHHPLTIDEWNAAVSQLDGVRLASKNTSAVNPSGGEVISINSHAGTAEILLEMGQWVPCFHFMHGQVSFKATENIQSSSDLTHVAAAKLAFALGAVIVGDEGEAYDW
ncbi:hypothetical protein [Herbaspirillum seropedicae]|uniref:hypothetical protein n=1 Tax=Herbaspirillum seropedicae TaxID=964 RepID=UPI0028553064|nr:hypothetical protein [Herbaspirillum seropedicae]MDR6395213.1 hypothetical protein [Herbaspirillum seropedicae]